MTPLVRLISGGDETAYKEETEWLTVWCRENNLLLNNAETKEVIVDFRRKKTDILPLYINGDGVERVVTSASWESILRRSPSELLKKAQQRLHFLMVLRKNKIFQTAGVLLSVLH